MFQLNLRKAIPLAAAVAMSAGAALNASPAKAAQTIDFAIWYSDRDFYAEHARKWAADIDKATEGRVKLKLHFSGSLVSAKETVNAVRSGAAGGGTTSISFLAGLFRPLSYMEPLLWVPADPKIGSETMLKIAPIARGMMQKRGLVLAFAFPSAGLVTNCVNGHVKSVSDWKGKKVRAAGRWQGIQLRALGAAPVAIDPGEVYIALQNKTVDCMMFLANLTLSAKIQEVAPYVTYWRDGANASAYYFNADVWNKIAPKDQQAILKVSDDLIRDTAPKLVQMQLDAVEALKKAGAKVHMATDAEISAFKQATKAVWDDVAKISGAAGKPIADIVMPLQK
ncbi:MAG: TRAP transporter substrate-binding protein [Beijerinckiaceae bacterium]